MKKISALLACFCTIVLLTTSCTESVNVVKHTDLELIMEHDQVLLPGESCEYSFNYRVIDAVEGGQIEVVIPPAYDWLELGSVNAHDESYGLITLKVGENVVKDNIRNAVITVKYNYDGKSVSKMFNLIQEFITLVYSMEAQYGKSVYYGDQYGYYNHLLYLTVTDPDQDVEGYFKLDLFTKENSSDMLPLSGVYSVVNGNYATGTDYAISDLISNLVMPDGKGGTETVYFKRGKVTIERNGDLYSVEGELYDDEGGIYRVTLVDKQFSAVDASHNSLLEDDVNEAYNDMFIDAYHVGNLLGGGSTNAWLLYLVPLDIVSGKPLIQLYLAYDESVVDAIEPGEFVPAYTLAPGTFLPGFFSAGCEGAWLSQYNDSLERIPLAPMTTGKIVLTQRENGNFDIVIESEDDNGHSIDITCANAAVQYSEIDM